MKRTAIAIVLLGSAAVLSGCDTVKGAYDSWFGAPAPSAKPRNW